MKIQNTITEKIYSAPIAKSHRVHRFKAICISHENEAAVFVRIINNKITDTSGYVYKILSSSIFFFKNICKKIIIKKIKI